MSSTRRTTTIEEEIQQLQIGDRVSVEFIDDDSGKRRFFDGTITDVNRTTISPIEHYVIFDEDDDKGWIDLVDMYSKGGLILLDRVSTTNKGTTSADEEDDDDEKKVAAAKPKKKRGRPKLARKGESASSTYDTDVDIDIEEEEEKRTLTKKKRGRPKREPDLDGTLSRPVKPNHPSIISSSIGEEYPNTPTVKSENPQNETPDCVTTSSNNLVNEYEVATATATAITPDNSESSDGNQTAPDPAPSSSNSRIQAFTQVLRDLTEDITVKQEGCASKLSDDERKKRKECLDRWIAANTDPRTNEGRYVFRRGCAKQCITKILGGHGMYPWPVVQRPPDINGGPNPFISVNQFYVAGDETFNPFGPRFPSDVGLVNCMAFDQGQGTNQKEFHLFVQCAPQPYKRHWHGKDAVGGRMYVGVYRRVVDDDDDDDVVTTIRYNSNDLDRTNKLGIAQFMVQRNDKNSKDDEELIERYGGWRNSPGFLPMKRRARAEAGEEDWAKKNENEKDVLGMYEKLKEENFEMDCVPVEFVRYDEDLYQALVDSGAVKNPKGRTGQVAVTPDALHQYY